MVVAGYGRAILPKDLWEEKAMNRILLVAAALGMFSATAFSMPILNQGNSIARTPLAENVKIICEESGVCYRPTGRRPVARWVYGDGAFYGPYDGPRNYGSPGRRYSWWWW
jgi:hypothetical protein